MTKILIVTGIFPPDIGGPASYVPRIAKELVNDGYEVSVICLSEKLKHQDNVYSFNITRIRRGIFKPLRIMLTILTIYRKAMKTDLIYVNGLGFESAIVGLITRKPIVHKVVADYAWERATNKKWYMGSLEEYHTAKKTVRLRILDWIRTFPLKYATKIIVPSGYLKSMIHKWGIDNKKIEVVYNGVYNYVSGEFTQELPPTFCKTLITVGRVIPLKKIDVLISIMPQLPECRLVIVGDGPDKDRLISLSKRLGLEDRVLFIGQVLKEQISNYLRQADCFVLNSIHEGLPHVVLEAMLEGIPVVATNVGGTGEIIKNGFNGFLITPGDERKLVETIQRVLSGKSEIKVMCSNAKNDVVERFASRTMVEKTEKLLIGCIK